MKLIVFLVVGGLVAGLCSYFFFLFKDPNFKWNGPTAWNTYPSWTSWNCTTTSEFLGSPSMEVMIILALVALFSILGFYLVITQSCLSCSCCAAVFTGLLFNCIQMLCCDMKAMDYWHGIGAIGNLPDLFIYGGAIAWGCSWLLHFVTMLAASGVNKLVLNPSKKKSRK